MGIPKLSEAIRLGTTVIGESHGYYFTFDGGKVCGCLIGTAMYANGYKPDAQAYYGPSQIDSMHAEFKAMFPLAGIRLDLDKIPVESRARVEIYGRRSLADVAEYLYECCSWTRERIADWVETIEQQLEAQATPQQEVEHVTN